MGVRRVGGMGGGGEAGVAYLLIAPVLGNHLQSPRSVMEHILQQQRMYASADFQVTRDSLVKQVAQHPITDVHDVWTAKLASQHTWQRVLPTRLSLSAPGKTLVQQPCCIAGFVVLKIAYL